MVSTLRRFPGAVALRCCAAVVLAAIPVVAPAEPAGIAPEARQILKASTDFLGSQPRFATDTRNSLEIVLKSGQKIEFNSTSRQVVQRPDKLRSERSGDLVEQLFLYDGKSLTLYQPQDKVYAQVAAPPTLEEMLDFARVKYDVVAPFGDLVFRNAYDILLDGVTEGLVVGKAVIEGVVCDHLAFRAGDVDWQIWIEAGARPLPRRIVVTTLDLPNAPQFAVTVTRWDLAPAVDAQTFRFTPPPGVSQIELLPR
jgi:hypothetical protein